MTPPIVAPPCPGDHDLDKLESTLPENTSHKFEFSGFYVLHLNRLEFPAHSDALCHITLKSAQWFRSKRWKWEMFITQTPTISTRTDKSLSEKLIWAFGSGEQKRCISKSKTDNGRPLCKNKGKMLYFNLKRKTVKTGGSLFFDI